MTTRCQFQELLSGSSVNLAHAALLAVQIIKRDSSEAVAATRSGLRQIDELTSRAMAANCDTDIRRLVAYLGNDVGLVGNTEHYYDPDNSDLSCVLKNRTGIPITLAIVYIEVGRALGFDLRGIGFPGHFLVGHYALDVEQTLIDPYSSQLTSRDACLDRLPATTEREIQQPQEVIEAWFLPATPQAIILRLLENLKQIYGAQNSLGPALAALELQLLLAPANFDLREQERSLLARFTGQNQTPKLH